MVLTMQLICAFVFAYANSRFSNDMAHLSMCKFSGILWHQMYELHVYTSSVRVGIIPILPISKLFKTPATLSITKRHQSHDTVTFMQPVCHLFHCKQGLAIADNVAASLEFQSL